MTSLPLDCVDIFDDFEDADSMEVAYCKLVSDEQYEEDTRSETDKALGDLCLYLDRNPELYARVLRKRKQEEMENAGVISYVKSKMMSLLHGEQYPHCLVSASECVQQTNALKVGMCKTFQLSQDLKGNVTRHSARLAAKKHTKMSKNKTNHELPLVLNGKEVENKPSNISVSPGKSPASGFGNSTAPTKKGAHPVNLTTASSSKCSVAAVPAIVVSQVHKGNINLQGNDDSEHEDGGVQKVHQLKSSAPEGIKTPRALLDVPSTIVLTPPLAPPLPAHFSTSATSRQIHQLEQQTPASARRNLSPKSCKKILSPKSYKKIQSPKPPLKSQLPKSIKTGQSPKLPRKSQSPQPHNKSQSPKPPRKTQIPKPHTPKSVEPPFSKKQRSSPRVSMYRVRLSEVPTRASSLQNLTTLSSSSSASSPFLTPEIPSRYRYQKHTQSNSSLSSLSSYGSCSSISSEILMSNPISRLKATPVIRSPGGTPLRQTKETVLSEPLHRALYTAIRSRFRNVNTPSPRSGNASINASNNSALNNTFSP